MQDPMDTDEMRITMYGDARPRGRFNIKQEDGSILGISLPIDITPEELEATMASVRAATAEVKAFRALPIEDQYMHYLEVAYKALGEITTLCQQETKQWLTDMDDGVVDVKRVNELRSNIFGIAETAQMQVGNVVRNKKGKRISIDG